MSGTAIAKTIFERILLIRGERMILDSDLADFYGIATKRLNEQVRRNRDRFPKDFVIQLTRSEKAEVVANCDHLANLKFSRTLPFAFTEHGALMAASVLSSHQAIEASVLIVRTFVRLRKIVEDNRRLNRRLRRIEESLMEHGTQIVSIVELVRRLTNPVTQSSHRIGFTRSNKKLES